jgi:hypothetical protein
MRRSQWAATIKASPKAGGSGRSFHNTEKPMNARQVLATNDYRELMQSLGVARSATDFCCPTCESRSFMVLRACPMDVECLKCGTVAPFSIRAADGADADAGPEAPHDAALPPVPAAAAPGFDRYSREYAAR